MRQVWIPKIGKPEVLELRESPDPEARAGEVRIRVDAAGINFADILARMGLYPDAPKLPAVVGYEVAGIIDQVGAPLAAPGNTTPEIGQRVVALTRFGGYSDVVTVPSESVWALPNDLSAEKAAAIPVNYLTAWLMLIHLGNVRAGDKVLIHAVAGGVGQAALQICRWRQAEVFGTASAGKHTRLKELGVSHCIDYHSQDFEAEIKKITEGRGVDIVIDAVGGDSFRKGYRSLAPLGRLFMFGVSSFSTGNKRSVTAAIKGLLSMPTFKPIPLMNDNRGVFGVNLGHLWEHRLLLSGILAELIQLASKKTFDPIVDKTFPFDQAADAHQYIQDHKNFGKVLLVP